MIHRHPLTGEWVILAPGRGQRPNAFDARRTRTRVPPASCPFCPGHEDETPPEILRRGSAHGWTIRVVPNRYPAVRSDHGVHEVVIESPNHQDDFDTLSAAHAAAVVEVYIERFTALATNPGLRSITLFRNDGWDAGQTIDHLHSQILALPLLPARAEMLAAGFARQPCVLCQMGEAESLMIHDDDDFKWFVPPVPLFPYEQWIVPRRHAASFTNLDGADRLAQLMQTAVRTMKRVLEAPSFNWIFHNSPLPERPHFHWFLQLFPRLALQGGLELGSGIQINIVDPHRAAAELKESLER